MYLEVHNEVRHDASQSTWHSRYAGTATSSTRHAETSGYGWGPRSGACLVGSCGRCARGGGSRHAVGAIRRSPGDVSRRTPSQGRQLTCWQSRRRVQAPSDRGSCVLRRRPRTTVRRHWATGEGYGCGMRRRGESASRAGSYPTQSRALPTPQDTPRRRPSRRTSTVNSASGHRGRPRGTGPGRGAVSCSNGRCATPLTSSNRSNWCRPGRVLPMTGSAAGSRRCPETKRWCTSSPTLVRSMSDGDALHMARRPSGRSPSGMRRGRPGSGTAKAQRPRALTPAIPRPTPTDDHASEETATSPFRPRSRGRRSTPSSSAVLVRRTHE